MVLRDNEQFIVTCPGNPNAENIQMDFTVFWAMPPDPVTILPAIKTLESMQEVFFVDFIVPRGSELNVFCLFTHRLLIRAYPAVRMTTQVPSKPLTRVVVSGSTHGNEMSGVFLARHWIKDPSELTRSTFSATAVIANPRAMEKCVRYTQQDLNRSFKMDYLVALDSEEEPYEVKRAKELNKIYGPKGSPEAYDFMFDMHNTTSNMGACIIVDSPQNSFAMHMANYIQTNYMQKCPIYVYKKGDEESYTIDSICKNGVAMEVGPQPQGVVRADCLAQMRALVRHGLDFIEKFNQGSAFPAFDIEAHTLISREDYPRNADGEMSGIIHPKLQDKDFLPLNPGDPIFQTLDGNEVVYEGDSTIYPAFINEAAYYEKKIAFAKMEKKVFSIPDIQLKLD
ncbi:hypothetical protein NDU88_000610 [Pleurodeles waltl]|uniref:N-acyl-aromatic-L-amino acid amidohydrolase n=2 Tax=Pleurodeles waltl TaxID=8319 RepID=A0AAV7SX14_PLEWA|nr:hypothetical protein NDU88_000610 [Pleurodeles waltl]